jgi:hypothetical protein
MPALTSLLDTGSAAFAANAARMAERLAEVRALEQKVREESASKRDKFEKRGQLLPRERVARLIDRGSDFIEFATLAGLGMHDDDGKEIGARRRLHHRHRHGQRQALRGHGQRQRDQGRHHPADGPEEEPARAGDRPRQQACR